MTFTPHTTSNAQDQFELAYATEWSKNRNGPETAEQLAAEVKGWREGSTYEAEFPRLRFGWEGYQWALAASAPTAPAEPSPTAGMNMAQRILHVGGRNPPGSTYIEFGSIQAVEALVKQVLRDMPGTALIAQDVQANAAIDPGTVVSYAVDQWIAEVSCRPLVNIHRRTLDGTWRQVMRMYGGDPDALVGPSHDDLLARAQQEGGTA